MSCVLCESMWACTNSLCTLHRKVQENVGCVLCQDVYTRVVHWCMDGYTLLVYPTKVCGSIGLSCVFYI